MKKHIYNRVGTMLLRIEEAEPVCGEDFCDECGDCMVCCDDTSCWDGGEHIWLEYEGELEEWIKGATP